VNNIPQDYAEINSREVTKTVVPLVKPKGSRKKAPKSFRVNNVKIYKRPSSTQLATTDTEDEEGEEGNEEGEIDEEVNDGDEESSEQEQLTMEIDSEEEHPQICPKKSSLWFPKNTKYAKRADFADLIRSQKIDEVNFTLESEVAWLFTFGTARDADRIKRFMEVHHQIDTSPIVDYQQEKEHLKNLISSSSKSSFCIDKSDKLPQLLNRMYLMQGLIRDKCFNYNEFVVVTWKSTKEAKFQILMFESLGAKIRGDIFDFQNWKQRKNHNGFVFDVFRNEMTLCLHRKETSTVPAKRKKTQAAVDKHSLVQNDGKTEVEEPKPVNKDELLRENSFALKNLSPEFLQELQQQYQQQPPEDELTIEIIMANLVTSFPDSSVLSSNFEVWDSEELAYLEQFAQKQNRFLFSPLKTENGWSMLMIVTHLTTEAFYFCSSDDDTKAAKILLAKICEMTGITVPSTKMRTVTNDEYSSLFESSGTMACMFAFVMVNQEKSPNSINIFNILRKSLNEKSVSEFISNFFSF
jgi:hypothetical protein